MNRRHFLITASAMATLPITTSAQMAPEGWQDYQPGMIESLLAEGKTVFVDYSASWCSTCKAQERAITAIRADSDAYEAMSYVRVDWDEYGRHAVTTSRKIPRRSTLLVLRGDAELGRIVAGTRQADIMALMDLGV
ncbi:MAG: thioredoxin family protein [Paracoccaceae bacterium]